VQRSLSAKNMSHVKGASILAGYLKLLPFIFIILPGMISRALYPGMCVCVCMHLCVHVCMHVDMRVCIHAYIRNTNVRMCETRKRRIRMKI
jgi:uncharacterized sodium:solute symporter family permease YidK